MMNRSSSSPDGPCPLVRKTPGEMALRPALGKSTLHPAASIFLSALLLGDEYPPTDPSDATERGSTRNPGKFLRPAMTPADRHSAAGENDPGDFMRHNSSGSALRQRVSFRHLPCPRGFWPWRQCRTLGAPVASGRIRARHPGFSGAAEMPAKHRTTGWRKSAGRQTRLVHGINRPSADAS